jgi:hypothetical protein
MGLIILVQDVEGVLLVPRIIQFTCTPLFKYPRKPLGSITYLLEFGRVLCSPSKTYKEKNTHIICNNIVNHETKDFIKDIYSMLTY